MKTTTTIFFVLIYIFNTYVSSAQCNFNLANDTTFCLGGSSLNFTITGPTGYDLYSWNTGETTQDITIDSNGTYICTASALSGDLVMNGDFTVGDTEFVTDYSHGTGGPFGLLSAEGTYAITTDPNLVHSNFYSFGDHTTGTGNMFVCNGSDTAGFVVWQQTITVTPFTEYNFSAWATSLENISISDVAELQFSINGVLIGPVFSPTLVGGTWTNFFENWNSGSYTSALIAIVDSATTGNNDFALDDIFFRQICSYTDSMRITGVPSPDIDPGTSQTILCRTSTVNLNGSSSTSGVSYSWTGPDIVSGAASAIATVDAGGNYIFTVTEPVNSCRSVDSVSVTLHTLPVVSFTTDTIQGCTPTTINFTGSTDQPGGTFFWDFGDAATSEDNSVLPNPTYIYDNAGTYSVFLRYTTTSDCVVDTTATGLILVHPHPVAKFDETPRPVSISEPTVSFLDYSTGDPVTWLWDFGTYGTSDVQNPEVIYKDTGTYAIKLIVTNTYGCQDSSVLNLEVMSIFSFYAPNAFTPDGDGLNDEFRVYGSGLDPTKFEMSIYDRFGELLYHTNDINKGWNGAKNNNGKISQQGIYTYKVVLTDFSGVIHKYFGEAAIVR